MQASATALFLLWFFPEWAFRRWRAATLRLLGVARLVLVFLFLLEACVLVKSRSVFAVRFAVVLVVSLVARFLVVARAAAGVLVVAPGLVRPLLGRRLTLWRRSQRIDADVVFLVGPPDFSGEGLRHPLGNLKIRAGVANKDAADVVLVDAATAANHRQQPARFRLLLPSNGGAEPNAALRHAMTRRCLSFRGSRPGIAGVVARRSVISSPAAIVTGPARVLAGIENIFRGRTPRPIQPRQCRGDILGRPFGEQGAREVQVVGSGLLCKQIVLQHVLLIEFADFLDGRSHAPIDIDVREIKQDFRPPSARGRKSCLI